MGAREQKNTKRKERAMTKRELIEALRDVPDDAEIFFEYASGDYWRTTLARPINIVDEKVLVYSRYHNTWKVIDDFEEGEQTLAEDEDAKNVVIIGA